MTLQEFLLELGIEKTELSTIKSVMRPNHLNILGFDLIFLNFSDQQYPDIKKITINGTQIEIEL